jgi:hypothetical protein
LRARNSEGKESEDQQLSFIHEQICDHNSCAARWHIGVMFGAGGEQNVVITIEQ